MQPSSPPGRIERLVGTLRGMLRGPDAASGAAVVEFAFVVPLTLLFAYGIIEFGRVLFTVGVLQYAAEEATRYAAVNYDLSTDQVKTYAANKLMYIDPAKITSFSVTAPVDPVDKTKLVTVQIGYQLDYFMPVVPLPSIQLTANSTGYLTDQ